MPGRSLALVFAVVVLTVLGAHGPVSAQTTHEDAGHGFSFQVPKRYKRLPVEKDRHCVLAHYISTREYPIKGVRWWGHRPSIRVVWLPKPKPVAVDASTENDESKGGSDWPRLVYADYRDYLARNLSGKLQFERPDKTEIGGLPCAKLRIERHEDRRTYYLETWSFERGEQTYAIEVMVLDDHREKVWPELGHVLESFRLTEEPQPLPKGLALPIWYQDSARWQELNVEQRASMRRLFEEELHAQVHKNLLPGWRLEPTDSCLIVTDSKARFVNVVKVAARECRSWLDGVFGRVTDEQVIKPVIRVFDSRTEYRYYRLRSRDIFHYVEPIHEIVVRSRGGGGKVGDLADLHSGLLHHYLNNKSVGLARHVPLWLQLGLYEHLRHSRVRGRRWELSPGRREKDTIRDAIKRKRLLMPLAIMSQQNTPWHEGDPGLNVQRGRLVRFLVDKRKGGKLMPDFLSTYLRAVVEAQKTFPLPPPELGRGDVADKDKDARNKQGKKHRRRLLEAVNQTVLDLDAKQWKAIDTAWRRYR